ncbi:MAG: hypothetical protein KC492_18825 [Myxococcales bacterium]|nr:hypothetical protein [Myxococcales bacterium]
MAVGPGAIQDLRPAIDASRQTDRVHELMDDTDAPARGRLNALARFAADP